MPVGWILQEADSKREVSAQGRLLGGVRRINRISGREENSGALSTDAITGPQGTGLQTCTSTGHWMSAASEGMLKFRYSGPLQRGHSQRRLVDTCERSITFPASGGRSFHLESGIGIAQKHSHLRASWVRLPHSLFSVFQLFKFKRSPLQWINLQGSILFAFSQEGTTPN